MKCSIKLSQKRFCLSRLTTPKHGSSSAWKVYSKTGNALMVLQLRLCAYLLFSMIHVAEMIDSSLVTVSVQQNTLQVFAVRCFHWMTWIAIYSCLLAADTHTEK